MEHTTQGLYMVLAGRFPSWKEREYRQKIRHRLRHTVTVLLVLTALLFAWEACAYSAGSDVGITVCTMLVNFVAGTALIWFPFLEKRRERTALQTAWYDEQADKTLLFFGCMYSLYDDRVVYTDCRSEKTLYWNNITVCTETPYGFLLETAETELWIRAADLTAEQASEVRIYLLEHDQNACYRKKGTLYGRSPAPLPLPVFENDDTVITRAQAVWRSRPLSKADRARVRGLYLNPILPVSLICATIFAYFLRITDVYFLDLILFCVGGAMIGWLLTALLTVPPAKKVPMSIAFTRDGVAVFANGNGYFAMNSRVRRQTTKKALKLTFSNGKTVSVPYAQIEDAEKIIAQP